MNLIICQIEGLFLGLKLFIIYESLSTLSWTITFYGFAN